MPCDTLQIQSSVECGILSAAVRVIALAVALVVGVAAAIALRKGDGRADNTRYAQCHRCQQAMFANVYSDGPETCERCRAEMANDRREE